MTQTRIAPGVGALSPPGPFIAPPVFAEALQCLGWTASFFCQRTGKPHHYVRRCRDHGIDDPRIVRWLLAMRRLHELLPGPVDEPFDDGAVPRFVGEDLLLTIGRLGWTPRFLLVRAGIATQSRLNALHLGRPLPLPVDRWLGRLYDADRQLTLDCPDPDAIVRAIHVDGHRWQPSSDAPRRTRRPGRRVGEEETRALAALQRLVELEPDPETIDSLEAYQAFRARHADLIASCEAEIRAYGLLFRTASPGDMRRAGQRLTVRLQGPSTAFVQGTAMAVLDRAWDGIGGWRK